MATKSASLQKKLDTLKKALGNKFIPASQKEKLKTQIDKIEKDMSSKKSSKSSKSAGAKASISKLDKLIKNKKYGVYKGAGVDLKKDGERPAKPIGKRKSKSGNTYYEYRANRIDVKQPSKKAPYPKLEEGGQVKEFNLREVKALSKDKQKYLTDDNGKDYIYENNVLYNLETIDKPPYFKKGTSHRMSKIKVNILEEGGYMAKGGEIKVGDKYTDKNNWVYDVLSINNDRVELLNQNEYYKPIEQIYYLDDIKRFIKKGQFKKMEKGGYMAKGGEVIMTDVYAKKDGKKVKVNERPMELKEAEKWVKEQGIEKYYTDVDFKYINKDFGYMAKGGEIAEYRIVPNKKDGMYVISDSSKSFRVNGTLMEANEAAQQFVKENNETYPTAVVTKLHTSGNPMKNKKVSYITKDEITKFEDGGYMDEGGVTEKDVVDSNAQMVLSQIKAVKHHADELSRVVSMKSNIEAWVVGKIERASTGLSDITHYLEGNKQMMSMGGSVRYYTHKMDKK